MKKAIIALACSVALLSCNSSQNSGGQVYVNNQPNVVVTPESSNLGDNLNLQALGELVKSSTTAQEIENKLNQPNSINNLDLDGDGKVDYIKVTEYGSGANKGFSFTVDLSGGQSQEIATIELQQGQGQQASMNINGNQNIYGNNNYYSSNYGMTDLLIWHYLFYPHPYYISPYRYGYYPSYYRPYGMVSRSIYGGRVGSVTRTSTIRRTTTTTTRQSSSPNRNLSSSSVNARAKSLSSPTRSQRSFSTTSNSRPSTSGFGNRSSSSSSSRSSSFGSSSRSSSSGRSSFGSSSHSSGGSRRSDFSFKKNIKPLSNSLDKICLLQGVCYDWRVEEFPFEQFDSKNQIGFIAQSVEKIYPAVVNTRPDGFKTVDYDLLVPALVESIKELKAITVKQDSIIQTLITNNKITAQN